jgi:tetraacyldisaccharide 4'-kinase
MQIEHYLFINSSFIEKIISFLLYPISFIYAFISLTKRIILQLFKKNYNIPIISIGNISLGGSGKTPFLISLIKTLNLKNTAIILRGFNRKSKGLLVVNCNNKIQCDTNTSGDEAMLYATSISSSIVIVSKNRIQAIKKAKKLGAK